MKNLSKRVKVDIGLATQSILNNNVIGEYFGMQMHRKAIAILTAGAMEASATAKIELLQAKDSIGTEAKAIDGATATITAASALTKAQAFVELDVSSLDINNGFEYIAAKVTTTAGTNAVPVSVTLIRGDGRFEPVQEVAASAVV